MDDYTVPKDKAVVLIDVPSYPIAERTVFLSAMAEHHKGRETVSDLLNRPNPFLPVQEEDGESVLVRKDAVRWIKVLEPAGVEWHYYESREGAPRKRIRCIFREGEALEGYVYAVAPEGHQRVSDIANREEGFLHVEADGDLYLVNARHVLFIRILEEK